MSRIDDTIARLEREEGVAHVEERAGWVIVVRYDPYPDNPRGIGDSPSTVVLHRSASADHLADEEVGESWGDENRPLRARARLWGLRGGVVIGVQYQDYGSGGSRLLSDDTFDADYHNGFMFCDRETVEREWSGDRDKARAYMRAEAGELDAWLRGDVYAVEILYPDGRETDDWPLVGGFYGDMKYAIDEARAEADARPYVRRAGHYPRLGMAVTS